MGLYGLHETRKQVTVHFRFRVFRVERFEVVNVNKRDGQRPVPVFAFGPEIGEIWEEEVGSLQNVELFIVLPCRKRYLIDHC